MFTPDVLYTMSFSDISNTFCPTDEELSSREKAQIQVNRILFLLGVFLCLLFIPLYVVTSPEAIDPTWLRVAVAVLLAGIIGASYLSKYVRRTFSVWVQGAVYGITAWFIVLTALNGFRGDYQIGLLLLYSMFTVIVGVGARSIAPVLWYNASSFVGAVIAILATDGSLIDTSILLGAMVTAALVLGTVIHRLISVRNRLQERESRLRGLANSTPGVVYQFYAREDGTQGTYFVSEHAREVLGIAPDPRDFYERFVEQVPPSHTAELLESVQEAIERKTSWQFEFPFEKPSGDRIWLLGTSTPTFRDEEIVFNGLLLDITERKKAENKLRQAKQEAEEASEVKTAMLANMSHEVRTPLTSIIGFSELLTDRLSGDLKGFARRTYESSQQLSETLKSILKLSKLEAGAEALERERVSITQVVGDMVELLKPKADEKSIDVEPQLSDEPVTGIWNEDAIRRIVRNLMENAIKFTPDGGQVRVRVWESEGEVVLEVEDTGIGISEELVPDIFQAFRQESEGITREFDGSGLGLSIVHHLVEVHRGAIQVDTEKGEGTCFTVRLPPTTDDNGTASADVVTTTGLDQPVE